MLCTRFLFLIVLSSVFFVDGDLHAEETKVEDLETPVMTEGKPGAGKRVRQVAVEYQGTKVYHALYLPTDWKPGGSFPVVVEYTGNKFLKCGSTGEVKDANLGYGLTGGKGFIWVSMPYIEKGGQQNALSWWGDRQATINYCKVIVPRICKEFGGDPKNVIICGFSRGAIATSYLGLADDEIAGMWKGVFTHDHFDGDTPWNYAESDRKSALVRLARLKGRPVLVGGGANDYLRRHPHLADFTYLRPPVAKLFKIPEGKVIHPHTDLWMHRDSSYRDEARAWLKKVISSSSEEKSLESAFEKYSKGCIAIFDQKNQRWIRHNADRCQKRFTPASTFKILHSLIGLETGAVSGPDHQFKWDGKARSIKAWNKDHDLRSAVSRSVVWYFEEVAKRVPPKKMNSLLKTCEFGNHKTSGKKPFWIFSDLAISADEQVNFLRKFHEGKLPFKKSVMDTVKELITLEKTKQWTLYGKTGWAQSGGMNTGWFVGWIETGENTFFFATNIESKSADGFGAARKAITMEALRQVGVPGGR